MTKEQFNSMELLEQVQWFNENLQDSNLTGLSKKLEIGRTTIVERFKKANYTYDKDLKQFIISNINEDNPKPLKSNLEPLNNIDLMDLLKRIEVLENKVSDLENKAEQEQKQFEINPHNHNIRFYPQHQDTTKTFRINLEVFNQWNNFSSKYNQYKQRDLVSSALQLYMELFENENK